MNRPLVINVLRIGHELSVFQMLLDQPVGVVQEALHPLDGVVVVFTDNRPVLPLGNDRWLTRGRGAALSLFLVDQHEQLSLASRDPLRVDREVACCKLPSWTTVLPLEVVVGDLQYKNKNCNPNWRVHTSAILRSYKKILTGTNKFPNKSIKMVVYDSPTLVDCCAVQSLG